MLDHREPVDALVATAQARLTALGPLRESFELKPRSTIVPPIARECTGLGLLERDGALELQGTIGEGGMGVVRLGVQTSLGRKVAVKTLRGESRDEASVVKLLREAWVTGSLEHPNILPIHDVRRDASGGPLVVLKLIEGVDWASVMHDPEAVEQRFGETDLFTHNLGVLMQVCRAVAFAHSRGIVHRDIKPDNIRIGSFGEVYLLDWGLAVSLREEDRERLPLAREVTELAGTPCYMAPEMLGGQDLPPITERTDVYLLGATLYEIIAGEPPHSGATAVDIVRSVLRSEPRMPEGTETELAQIVCRAMALDPEERYAGADELRAALEEFIAHRGSIRLSDLADVRLRELEKLLQAPETPATRVHAYDLFGACRAGYQSALEQWPRNMSSREGLRGAQLEMVEYELRRGDARAAQALLAELSGSPEGLEARIAAGVTEQDAEDGRLAALEELGRDLDPRVGQRTRMTLAAGFIGVWGVIPIVFEHLVGLTEGYREAAITAAAALAAILLGSWWARETLRKTAVNRVVLATMIATMVGHFVVLAGGWLAGLPLAMVEPFFFLLWMALSVGVTFSISRTLWPMIAANLVSFLLASAHPEQRHWIMLVNNLVIAATLVFAWPLATATRSAPD